MLDVIVVGGGQAGLATAYHLRKAELRFVVLDSSAVPGGGWPGRWDGLRLFSPASASSLPGMMMPSSEEYPPRDHVVDYLRRYEARYGFPIERPVEVAEVVQVSGGFEVRASGGRTWLARTVVSATGGAPYQPTIDGRDLFTGKQLHSSAYRTPSAFAGRSVLIVGGGNSGAQILAEVSTVANVTWATLEEPRFMADDVDGRALFALATRRRRAQEHGQPPPCDLGSIGWSRPSKTQDAAAYYVRSQWSSGSPRAAPNGPTDTARRSTRSSGAPAFGHGSATSAHSTSPPGPRSRPTERGRGATRTYGSSATATGLASATPIGVGRTAKQTAHEISGALEIKRATDRFT